MNIRIFFKRIAMAALVVFAMAALSGAALAAVPTEYWTDQGVPEDFTANGSGTEDEPWLIGTAEELAFLAHEIMNTFNWTVGKHFQLTSDIDLEGKLWTPIGTKNIPFRGSFDGDGFVIENMTVGNSTNPWQDNVFGLFGAVSGDIKNVGLVDISIDASIPGFGSDNPVYIGGITGRLAGSVSNSFVSGDISVTTEAYASYIGGIVGRVGYADMDAGASFPGSVTNTYALCDVDSISSGTALNVGGLVGFAYVRYTTISSSYSWGSVTGAFDGGVAAVLDIGGLVGAVGSTPLVENCDWLKDANPDLDGLGSDEHRPYIDQSVHAVSLDLADFGVANMAHFTDRGWDFGAGAPDYAEAVWCYIVSDGKARPHLRSFYDASAFVEEDDENDSPFEEIYNSLDDEEKDNLRVGANVITSDGMVNPSSLAAISADDTLTIDVWFLKETSSGSWDVAPEYEGKVIIASIYAGENGLTVGIGDVWDENDELTPYETIDAIVYKGRARFVFGAVAGTPDARGKALVDGEYFIAVRDADGKLVVSPMTVLVDSGSIDDGDKKQTGGGSGVGCDTGLGLFGILGLLPLLTSTVRRRR